MTVQSDIADLLARVDLTLDMPAALRAELATALNAANITTRVATAVGALNVPGQVATAVAGAVPAAATAAVATANISGQVAAAVTAQVAPAVAQATAGSANVAMVNVWLNAATGVDTAAGTNVAPVATIDAALAKIPPGGRGTIFLQGNLQINKLPGNPDRVFIDQGRSVLLTTAGNGRHEVTWGQFSAQYSQAAGLLAEAWRQFEIKRGSALMVTGLRITPPPLMNLAARTDLKWFAVFVPDQLQDVSNAALPSIGIVNCQLNVPVTHGDAQSPGRILQCDVTAGGTLNFTYLSNTWVNVSQQVIPTFRYASNALNSTSLTSLKCLLTNLEQI